MMVQDIFMSPGTCCPFVLKQASVPIDNTTVCNTTSHLQGQITDNMFCAGHGGNDACSVSRDQCTAYKM